MSNELTTIQQEQVVAISTSAPQALKENKISFQRCTDVGNALLAEVEKCGMDDERDQKVAAFIEKAKKTVRKMNDKRTPITKLFDDIRSQFTTLENSIDPTKSNNVVNQLQQCRNRYAQLKHQQEEQKRQAVFREHQRQGAIAKYRTDVDAEFRKIYNDLISNSLAKLGSMLSELTLDNYENTLNTFDSAVPSELPLRFFHHSCSETTIPFEAGMDANEAKNVCSEVIKVLLPEITKGYSEIIGKAKTEFGLNLPAKKQELERVQKAGAEEAERIRQQMAEREAEEAKRREAERLEREKQEAEKAVLAKQTQEINALFGMSADNVEQYQPKTSVKKKIQLLNPEGIMPVISMWWLEEGCKLSVEELSKIFKKQLTYCEKVANSKTDARFLEDESICYVDDVKAK